MNDWQTVRLGDAITLQRGFDLPSQHRVAGNIPLVSSAGITDFHNEAKATAPGVVTGRYGTIGKHYYVKHDYWPLNTALFVSDFKGNDARFVYYLLHTLDFQAYSDKSGVPGVNRNDVETAQIRLPPLPQQRAIAHILGSLDDKIELNRRMNATLEELAQTHFRTLMATAKDENGDLRDGWREAKLGEVMDVNSRSIGRGYPHSVIEYVDIASVSEGQFSKTTPYTLNDAPSRARRIVQDGDTIWSTVRPNRRSFGYIHQPTENLIVSTGFAVLSPKRSEIPPSYLYAWTTTQEFTDYLTFNADGSAYPAVLPGRFDSADILIPHDSERDTFDRVVSSLRDKIAANERQNRALAELRDTLLPKLLSGELRVSNLKTEVLITAPPL